MRRSEVIFIAVVVAAIAAGILFDATVPSGAQEEVQMDAGRFVSTGWYCPVPPGEDVDATMATGNLGTSALGLRRSAIGGTAQSAVDQASIEARTTGNKLVGDFGVSESTGLVEAFGGNNTTSLMVLVNGRGVASSRCSAQPASRWLFATGSTARGDGHYLLISNPFREEAVVRARLMTPEDDVVPARLKDLVIRPFSQSAVYLSDYLQEAASFGIEVTASRGRVVVSRYSNVNSGGGKGISLDVGAQAPSSEWVFAGGEVPSDGEESIVLVNPGSREALVGMVFMTDEERTAPPDLAEIAVPAGRQVVVKVSDHLPRGTSYGVEVNSTNDVPVMAERRTAGIVDKNRSYESTFGVSGPAGRWTVPVGSPSGGDPSIAMVNTGQTATTVKVTLLTEAGESAPSELSSLTVEPGRKLVVDLKPHIRRGLATAVVEADRPVLAVESQLVLVGTFVDYASTPGQVLR